MFCILFNYLHIQTFEFIRTILSRSLHRFGKRTLSDCCLLGMNKTHRNHNINLFCFGHNLSNEKENSINSPARNPSWQGFRLCQVVSLMQIFCIRQTIQWNCVLVTLSQPSISVISKRLAFDVIARRHLHLCVVYMCCHGHVIRQ